MRTFADVLREIRKAHSLDEILTLEAEAKWFRFASRIAARLALDKAVDEGLNNLLRS